MVGYGKKQNGDIFGLHTVNISRWSEMLEKCCNQAVTFAECAVLHLKGKKDPDASFRLISG